MSIKDADEILADDRNEIEMLIKKYDVQNNFNLLIQIAQKSDFLGDLYYDAMEEFNDRFFYYKEQAALYYRKLAKRAPAKEIKFNSRLLAVLLLIQADQKNSAIKRFKNLRIKHKKQSSSEIDKDWFLIVELIINGNLKSAKKRLRNFKTDMDSSLYNFFLKTIKIAKNLMDYMSKRKSTTN